MLLGLLSCIPWLINYTKRMLLRNVLGRKEEETRRTLLEIIKTRNKNSIIFLSDMSCFFFLFFSGFLLSDFFQPTEFSVLNTSRKLWWFYCQYCILFISWVSTFRKFLRSFDFFFFLRFLGDNIVNISIWPLNGLLSNLVFEMPFGGSSIKRVRVYGANWFSNFISYFQKSEKKRVIFCGDSF